MYRAFADELMKIANPEEQQKLEDWLNRMRDDARDRGYHVFAVAGHPEHSGVGASFKLGGPPGSAVHNARQAHIEWELKNGIDPYHDRNMHKTSAEDFALGLPAKDLRRPIPETADSKWMFNIQRHDAKRAGLHYDLRLKPPGREVAYSWAIPKAELPQEVGDVRLAMRTPDHRASYMGFSGELTEGHGRGMVTSEFHDAVPVSESNTGKIKFEHDGKNYMLHHTSQENTWLLRRTA